MAWNKQDHSRKWRKESARHIGYAPAMTREEMTALIEECGGREVLAKAFQDVVDGLRAQGGTVHIIQIEQD